MRSVEKKETICPQEFITGTGRIGVARVAIKKQSWQSNVYTNAIRNL